MKRSTNRILTTHVGSLIRPQPLQEFLRARQGGKPHDQKAYDACLTSSVADVVRQQAQTGIDVVSDGEFGKAISWSQYALERLSGFERRPIKHGADNVTFDKQIMALLSAYPWPGNVRELENLVERLLIMRNSDAITFDDLPDKIRNNGAAPGTTAHPGSVINLPDEGYSLEQLEREVVVQALERTGWNQTAASRFLRIPRHTLIYRMEKYEIITPEKI